MFRRLAFAACFALFTSFSAFAQAATPDLGFSLEGGIGTHFSTADAYAVAAYRLPVADRRIDVLGYYSFSGTQSVGVGSRYYLLNEGMWQPYVEARAGLGIVLSPPVVSSTFQGYLGAGTDLMWTEHWGVTARLLGGMSTGLTAFDLRAEAGLKYIF